MKRFYEKKIKNDAKNESFLQKTYKYPVNPRDSKIY